MRKWSLCAVALLAATAIAFLTFGPGIVERGMNRIVATDLPTVTPQTHKLHASHQIADLHGDTLLWKRDLLDPADRRHADHSRLIASNVALPMRRRPHQRRDRHRACRAWVRLRGSVTTGFDTSQLVYVTQALVDRGFTPDEIAKVMGGNVLRVLRAGIAPQ